MPDNDPILNCASGACCRPPMQQKALAVALMKIAEDGAFRLDADDFLLLAEGLIERGLIGVSPEVAARLKKSPSPTEAELDALLAE